VRRYFIACSPVLFPLCRSQMLFYLRAFISGPPRELLIGEAIYVSKVGTSQLAIHFS
jgi:hypothetical protein